MRASIYKPAQNAMQSGRAAGDRWVLEYQPESPPAADPLMGYTSSSDMQRQVRLEFDSRDDAVAYAERQGIAYQVAAEKERVVKPASYSDNFRFSRQQPWTH